MDIKNFFTVIISTILSLVVCYFLFFLNIHFKYLHKHPYRFKSVETLDFNKKYYNKFHHLRPANDMWEIKNNPENYLFNIVNNFSINGDNILIQGDSWIQQLHILDSKMSHKLINNFAKKKNLGLINGGISSFSPSLMQLQFEVLEKDFNFKPNIVIAYIDQTDLGDELCRYKDKRVYDKNNNLIAIKKEHYTRATYDFAKIFYISEVVLSHNSTTVINFKITNFFIKYEVLRFFNKIKTILKKGWKNKDVHKCSFPEIKKYLLKSSNDDIAFFENRLRDYLNILLNKEYIEKIILITFPHYTHIYGYNILNNEKENYTVNVSNIVERIIDNNQKIHHLNFSKLIFEGKIKVKKKSFIGDAASHLTGKAHSKIFTQELIKFLNKN